MHTITSSEYGLRKINKSIPPALNPNSNTVSNDAPYDAPPNTIALYRQKFEITIAIIIIGIKKAKEIIYSLQQIRNK